MNNKRVTIKDLADQLGYSKSTISRALNDRPGISEEVKTEIRIFALEMGYDLKYIQRTNKRKVGTNGKTVSIIVTRENFLDEIFFRTIIREIEQVLFRQNISLNFSIIENREYEDCISSMLRKLKPDGAIVFGLVSKKSITDAVYSGYPIVFVDVPKVHLKVDRIAINNFLGCYEAATYLIQEGHKRITFLGDIEFSDNMSERYNGCRGAVEKLDGEWIESQGIVTMDMTSKGNIDEEKLKALMFSNNRPTAIICANDRTAIELYETLAGLGLKIPADVSVIGFDNIEKCQTVSPPLTSIDMPKVEMSQEAVRMLLERIKHPEKATALLRLDTKLVVRGSVKNLNEAKAK